MVADSEEEFCYLTTSGRRTGRPHRIEIWFGQRRSTFYLLAGGGRRADWVRNLVASPAVRLRVGDDEFDATARIVEEPDEDLAARRMLAAKYQGWDEGTPMSDWAAHALAIAIDVKPS